MLALGGNLPGGHASVQAALEAAVGRLRDLGYPTLACSRWWRSAAWPDPRDPAFLNGVVLTVTDHPPLHVLADLRRVEAEFGVRSGPRNSPRVLDLDLIAQGRLRLETPELVLPHPRAAERLFVMGPLAEIAPDWLHPVLGESARVLAASARVGRDAEPAA